MAIENLDIQISSSADRASQSIDSMIERLTRLQTMLTDVASRVNNIQWPTNAGAGGGFDGLREAANNANSLGEAIDNVTHQAGGLAGAAGQAENLGNSMANAANRSNLLTSALGGVARATYSVGAYFGGQAVQGIKKYVSGLGNLFSSLKRIAMYRVIRTVIKEITQGFAEGQKNLYNWSKSVGGTFATNMNTIATASQYLKNSLAAMASPLYTAVAPAIDYIVDKFVDMFNFVNQLFARLSGATTYTVAKKVAATWGDASKHAGATAAAAKRTILSFDEINKLTSASSGGSGSGGSGSSGSGMFETETIDQGVSTFADSLKEAFQNQDWQALGTLLGEKVNELVEKIDWAGAGTKVGTFINGWFSTQYWTLDTINFTNIGSKIAEFLNNAIAQIDFNIIGRSLVQKAEILGDLIIGFFTNFDWGQAAESFSSFVKGIYDEITKWFNKYANSEEMNWGDIGRIIWEKLSDALANFDLGGIASSMMTALGTALRSAIQLGAGFVAAFWSDVTDWWDKNIKADTFSDTVSNILAAIGEGFSDIGQWVFDNIIDPFVTALTGNEDWDTQLLDIGKNIIENILTGIINVVSNIRTWIKEHIFQPFISAWNWLFGKKESNELGEDMSNAVVPNAEVDASQAEELKKLGREMGKYIKDGISSKMKNAGNDAWDAVVSGWNGVKDKTLNAELTFTSSDDAWTTFKAGWDTQSHVLEFGAAWSSDSPDGELYSTFIQGWNSTGSKSLFFSPKLDNQAQVLYNGFKTDWDDLPSKSLYFSPKLDNQAQVLYNGFKKDWDDMGSTSLYFSPKLDNQAQVLYNGFKKDWNDLPSNSLYFSPKLDNTAKVLFDGFRRDWNALDSNSLYFSPKLDNTAKVLFDGFKKAWEEASSPLKVDVEVNWDGSGTGSGGGTSGGGNGRYTMPVTLETPTQDEVKTYWDALKKHWDNLSQLGIAVLGLTFSGVDAEGVATIWDLLQRSWDSGVVATGKYLEMVVQPISSAGQTLAEGASNFWNWLFGKDITTQGPTLDLEFEANAVLSPEVQLDQWQHKMDEWAEELGIEVPVTATVATKASTVAYNFQQAWIKLTSGSKTVSFINQLRNAASGLAYAFQQSWIKLGNPNKQVSFINQLRSGANTLAYNFQQAWIGLTDNSKKVSFINQLKVAASSLAYGFQQGWIKLGDGAKQVSFLNVLRSGASALAYGFQQNWIGLTDDSKKVSFLNQLRNAAGGLAYGFLQNWIGLDDSKKQISFLNKLNTGAGTAAAGFLDKWGQLDDEKKSVSLINNLTRSGSNWSGKKGAQKWWEAQPGTSGVSLLTNLTNSGSNWAEGLLKFLTGNKDGIVSIALNIGGTIWDKVKSALGWLGVPGFANGGIIGPNGIASFANGGILNPHGTLFRAGENGPEIVGHIGGRTEVLNRSQLASTMYSSVRAAMAPAFAYEAAADEGMELLGEYMMRAVDAAMAKDRELMRQQNEYLRQINDKEFTAEISTAAINRAQNRTNRRAGTPVSPVAVG